MTSTELLQQGIEAAEAGRRSEARELLMKVVEDDPRNETAWSWLAGLMVDLEERISACETVLKINPNNERIRVYLSTLLKKRATEQHENESRSNVYYVSSPSKRKAPTRELAKSPLWARAEEFEQAGKLDEALDTYEQLASETKDSETFDHIFKQITRLENLRKEKIQYVAPTTSIFRMTFAWPLLYFSFALVQMGFNPFAHSRFYLWFSLPVVALGSFLLALSEIRVRHAIWQTLFMEDGNGSSFARVVLAIAGWIFVVVPFGLILMDSLGRLHNLRIPPEPTLR